MTDTENDRNPLLDIANELSRLGEAATEGDYSPEQLRDRLWALSARLNVPGGEQVRRVGVVVFCEVCATTDGDAETIAEMAVRQLVPDNSIVMTQTYAPEPKPVQIEDALGLGRAVRNGYTQTRVNGQAWRYSPNPMWDGKAEVTT